MTPFSRRDVLCALAALGASPAGLSRALAAGPATGKTLVTIFLRGGVDGLAMVAPVGEPALRSLRPRLFTDGVGLDGFFALHPALAPLAPLYRARALAVLHAVGQDRPSRSHFDAQDFLETGMAGRRGHDGYLNRVAASLPAADGQPFRVVAVQSTLPTSLSGPAPALAIPSLRQFKVPSSAVGTFEALYAGAVDEALQATGREAFTGVGQTESLAAIEPRNGARYPQGVVGRRLQDIARLIHAGVGVRVATTELGGFDTHLAQGAAQGQLAGRLTELASALAAFATDLGARLDDVLVLTLTEFGRTVRENGTGGTDHGTASAMLALGGGVGGGRVLARWPGLSDAALHEGRDLAVTTDVRAVLAEAIHRTLGIADIFPGFSPQPVGLFQV